MSAYAPNLPRVGTEAGRPGRAIPAIPLFFGRGRGLPTLFGVALCGFHEHLDDAEQHACQTKHAKWYVEVDDEAERVRVPQKEFGIPHGRGWRIQASPLFIAYLEGMAEDTA
ncbi:hypothetical protein LTR15_012696 [Elasticomyces elasticus]|nr:hypothetical protein LTR15_012696 [Elasticomyces elasticus]